MAITCGIVGLPNVGKSTLFNALTQAGAPVSAYPFSTVQANIGVVNVPDKRLDGLARLVSPKKITPTNCQFVDIAGLVTGSSRGEGLGNDFLGQIRNADALAVVVRTFPDERVSHVNGGVDAARDLESLSLELVLADLSTVEKRMEKGRRSARSGDKKAVSEFEALQRLHAQLDAGKPVRHMTLNDDDQAILKELFLLTTKPVMYVANVSEDALAAAPDVLALGAEATGDGELADVAAVARWAAAEGARAVAVAAKLEAELQELAEEEARDYLEALGLPDLGADQVVNEAYRLLNLISFLTAGEPEVRAWTITRGTKAPQAAGKIHSDIERGFIRAELVPYEDLMAAGSYSVARERGLLRLEGKEYVMKDGDVVNFRYNV